MKPYTWLMSKVLSPGAFAVWHSMVDPEEWTHDDDDTLVHKTTGLQVLAPNWRTQHRHHVPRPVALVVLFIAGSFLLDCKREHAGAIGHLERHLIAGRAYRLVKRLHRRAHPSNRRGRNRAVFALLTVNERVKT